jgi:hypothetical protein
MTPDPESDAETDRKRATEAAGGRSRRALLRLAAVGAVGALAGCTGGDSETTPTATATATGTPTATTTPTATPTTTAVDGAGLATAAQTFVEQLAAGEFEAATERLAPDLAGQVGPAALEELWASLQRETGAFVGVDDVRLTTVSGFDAAVVTARFSQGQRGVRVVFDDQARIAGLQFVPVAPSVSWEPPAYVDGDAFETRSASVSGPGDCSLPAEITVPTAADGGGDAPPSLVLLGGSGPTDLDGSLGPNRPYRDLAYGLASRSVASLRYTKRTAACQVSATGLTIDDEYTTDALSAIERLRAAEATSADRVVVAGHSLGALLAPRVAERADGVAAVVMLAPPGRPLWDLVVGQTRYLAELDGSVSDAERARIEAVTDAAARIENGEVGEGEVVLGGGRAYWESLRAYDAFETAQSLSVPLLVVFGGRDYQVSGVDETAWRSALDGVDEATVRTYETLNHLFAPGEGPSSPAEYEQLDHVSADLIADLDDWITDRW